jgi:hypothetical protein
MKLSNVSLDLKSLVLGAMVGGILMLSVGAATITGSPSAAKWDYKVAAPPGGTFVDPNAGSMGMLERQQTFLNEFGKEGWVLVTRAEGNVFYFKRAAK